MGIIISIVIGIIIGFILGYLLPKKKDKRYHVKSNRAGQLVVVAKTNDLDRAKYLINVYKNGAYVYDSKRRIFIWD